MNGWTRSLTITENIRAQGMNLVINEKRGRRLLTCQVKKQQQKKTIRVAAFGTDLRGLTKCCLRRKPIKTRLESLDKTTS